MSGCSVREISVRESEQDEAAMPLHSPIHRAEQAHYYSCHNSLAVRAAAVEGSRLTNVQCRNTHTHIHTHVHTHFLTVSVIALSDCPRCAHLLYLVWSWVGRRTASLHRYVSVHACGRCVCVCVCATARRIPSLTLALRSAVPLLRVGQVVKHPGSSLVLVFCWGAKSLVELSAAALPALHPQSGTASETAGKRSEGNMPAGLLLCSLLPVGCAKRGGRRERRIFFPLFFPPAWILLLTSPLHWLESVTLSLSHCLSFSLVHCPGGGGGGGREELQEFGRWWWNASKLHTCSLCISLTLSPVSLLILISPTHRCKNTKKTNKQIKEKHKTATLSASIRLLSRCSCENMFPYSCMGVLLHCSFCGCQAGRWLEERSWC